MFTSKAGVYSSNAPFRRSILG